MRRGSASVTAAIQSFEVANDADALHGGAHTRTGNLPRRLSSSGVRRALSGFEMPPFAEQV